MRLADRQYAIGSATRRRTGPSSPLDYELQEEGVSSDTDVSRVLRACRPRMLLAISRLLG